MPSWPPTVLGDLSKSPDHWIRQRFEVMKSMTTKLYYTAGILTLAGTLADNPPNWALTHIECNVLDRTFVMVKQCAVTKNAGGRWALNARIQPLQQLDNITIKMNVLRKFGKSYRPFFIEATVDMCSFLKNYKHQIPWGLLYGRIAKYTNMNHSCPYDLSDLYVQNYSLMPDGPRVVPKGSYVVHILFLIDKVPKVKFQIFFTRYK